MLFTQRSRRNCYAYRRREKSSLPTGTAGPRRHGGRVYRPGFLLDFHVISSLPPAWGSFGVFLGASVFPVGLVLTVLAGGELLTGNKMTLPMALFSRQIGVLALIRNWFWVTLANFIGSLMIAWFFGHILGMTEGAFLAKTVATAHAKISAGQATWHDYVINFPPVFLGNAVGGGIFVALIYFNAYRSLGGQSHA